MATTDKLRDVFSDMFVLYFRAHAFHWNVRGLLFPLYHDFFGKIYNQTWQSLDTIAEQIRGCGELAPFNIYDVLNNAEEPASKLAPGTTKEMVNELYTLNQHVIMSLIDTRMVAESERNYGVVNFVEGLIDAHNKLDWMLSTTLREQE